MDWNGVYENAHDGEPAVLTPLTDFPMVISNSMRVAFVACPQKFFRSYVQGWSPSVPSVHLTAGKAFAKGMEITRRAYYEQGISETESIALGYAEVIRAYGDIEYQWHKGKTATRMAEALLAYFEEYPLAIDVIKPLIKQDGTAAVEFTFAIPIPECIHPQTGEQIIHSGRFDMLGQHDNGLLFVVDEKTTSQLGDSWAKQWELNSQFTAYCFAAREYGYKVSGAIIRGISILKNSFGHSSPMLYRADWEIDRWYAQMVRDTNRMIQSYNEGYWDYNLAASCANYGGCHLLNICSSNDPDRWLEAEFVVKKYDPLAPD